LSRLKTNKSKKLGRAAVRCVAAIECGITDWDVLMVNGSSPVTGPEGPRGFQEIKVPRFRDNGTGWW